MIYSRCDADGSCERMTSSQLPHICIHDSGGKTKQSMAPFFAVRVAIGAIIMAGKKM